jgi:hypothetical protein
MNDDLKRAFETLNRKTPGYNKLFRYYDGDQPLTYAAKRLEEVFKGLDAVFIENWCSVVIDSVKDRVNLTGFKCADAAAQDALDSLWNECDLNLESDDVHESAMIAGEGYFIAWPDELNQPQGFANDPRNCQVFYSSSNPRIITYAAKWWIDDDLGIIRMTLYYPDHLEYYQTDKKADNVSSVASFQPSEPPTDVNPFGEIPVFHFRIKRRSANGYLENVLPIQNGINKLLTDMMVAAEFGAFSQRYVISNSETQGKLKNAPGIIWHIPAGDGIGQGTTVGQFQSNDLGNYLKAIDNLAGTLSSITRTPKHFFVIQGGDPSGEALIAMESPLVKKSEDFIDRMRPVWQHVAAFMLKIKGIDIRPGDITPVFDMSETTLPVTNSQVLTSEVNAGVPLEIALGRQGWTKAEIDELTKLKDAAAKTASDNLAKSLLNASRQFNAGDGPAANNGGNGNAPAESGPMMGARKNVQAAK